MPIVDFRYLNGWRLVGAEARFQAQIGNQQSSIDNRQSNGPLSRLSRLCSGDDVIGYLLLVIGGCAFHPQPTIHHLRSSNPLRVFRGFAVGMMLLVICYWLLGDALFHSRFVIAIGLIDD